MSHSNPESKVIHAFLQLNLNINDSGDILIMTNIPKQLRYKLQSIAYRASISGKVSIIAILENKALIPTGLYIRKRASLIQVILQVNTSVNDKEKFLEKLLDAFESIVVESMLRYITKELTNDSVTLLFLDKVRDVVEDRKVEKLKLNYYVSEDAETIYADIYDAEDPYVVDKK